MLGWRDSILFLLSWWIEEGTVKYSLDWIIPVFFTDYYLMVIAVLMIFVVGPDGPLLCC